MFIGNYSELDRALRYHADTRRNLELWAVRKQYKMEAFQRNIIRLTHNFVASAQSLVDHTRVLYKKLCQPRGLLPEFEDEIKKRFQEHGPSSFVVGLRQYYQHYRIPQLLSRLSFSSGDTGR